MPDRISLVIADDHPIFRQGLRQVIQTVAGFEILGEAGDGESALELVRRHKPAVAILDVSMPRLDGFEVVSALTEESLPVKVIFLTMFREKKFFDRALDLGVKGYVLKDNAVADIVGGINAVARGEHFVSPELTSHLVRDSRIRSREPVAPLHGLAGLSPAERRILALIAEYKTSREIAEELGISPRTVETHRMHICQKLGLHGSHALMKFALDSKADLLP
jgi:DNA-binding NarL/FixJ family response regulator